MSTTKECFHAVVRGRVQGVSFRYYTQARARQLGISGWVKNLPDGSVEVMAAGDRASLNALLDFLRVGPRSARVADLSVEWRTPPETFRDFDVRY